MTDRRPALQDVAARAGVSHQTVSRVLNQHPHVAPATRVRVEQAIADLGYRRNMSARALATGRTDTLGAIAPSSILYGPSATVAGLARAAREASMTFVVDQLATADDAAVRDSVDRLLSHGIAGLFLVLPTDAATDLVTTTVPPGTPTVTVDRLAERDLSCVSVDQHGGAALATRHLLERGHATVRHVAGPADWNDSRAREQGWLDTLRAADADVPPVVRGDWTPASGYAAGRDLGRDPACTAVFVANDHMALGVVRALVEAGRRVPDDVAVVGFDDVPEAPFFSPPLTTVHQDFAAVGRAGVASLLAQIADAAAPRTSVLVPATLVERASSGLVR